MKLTNNINAYYIIILYYLTVNLASFFMFYIDKRKAKKNSRRIPENKLFMSAFLGGGIGALLGMKIFRHKTQKNMFKIFIPVAIGLHLYIIYIMLVKTK